MNIVVGFVDTPEGHAAIERAIEEAGIRQGKVVVVHSMRGGGHEDPEDYIAANEAMDGVHHRLHEAGVEHCTHDYVRGNSPAEDLQATVQDHDARLVVIGIRRRSTTGKVLLGSNALEILHDSTVPVLCVKAED